MKRFAQIVNAAYTGGSYARKPTILRFTVYGI